MLVKRFIKRAGIQFWWEESTGLLRESDRYCHEREQLVRRLNPYAEQLFRELPAENGWRGFYDTLMAFTHFWDSTLELVVIFQKAGRSRLISVSNCLRLNQEEYQHGVAARLIWASPDFQKGIAAHICRVVPSHGQVLYLDSAFFALELLVRAEGQYAHLDAAMLPN